MRLPTSERSWRIYVSASYGCPMADHFITTIQSTTKPCNHSWDLLWSSYQIGRIAVAHVMRIPGTFSPPPRVSDPGMHHGTCVTHVPWCMPGSLISGFLWSWWRGNRPRLSRRMCNLQFYVTGKRSMRIHFSNSNFVFYDIAWLLSLKLLRWHQSITSYCQITQRWYCPYHSCCVQTYLKLILKQWFWLCS